MDSLPAWWTFFDHLDFRKQTFFFAWPKVRLTKFNIFRLFYSRKIFDWLKKYLWVIWISEIFFVWLLIKKARWTHSSSLKAWKRHSQSPPVFSFQADVSIVVATITVNCFGGSRGGKKITTSAWRQRDLGLQNFQNISFRLEWYIHLALTFTAKWRQSMQ